MHDRGLVALDARLERAGSDMLRFNFPYRDKGSARPDPMRVLTRTIESVVARVRAERQGARLVIGGRSMGGRAASMLAAQGFACDGLLLLAYPLHPAGQTEKLRAAHLAAIRVPTLCINGTRDALCQRDLMHSALGTVGPDFRMHWVDGADHSFHVLKASGRDDEAVLDEIAAVAVPLLLGG